MFKDILVHLKVGDDIVDNASDYAVSLAAALDAHLTGVAGSFEIDVPQIYTEAFSTDFIETQRIEARRLAAQAIDRFQEAARSLALTAEVETIDGTIGGIGEQIGVLARLYDLTVVSQPDPDRMGSDEVVAEAVLFDSGRPLLMVPLHQQKPFAAKRILVAWDGSRTAARAVAEARCLIAKADLVEVAIVHTARGKARDLDGADIAAHLSRTAKAVELRVLEAASGEKVVDVLLKEVAAREIDLLAMGGYGHSRLREFVLGGVTRDVLDRMTVPVLMAH